MSSMELTDIWYDLRYAIEQVKRCRHPVNGVLMDSAQRALDALERIDANLTAISMARTEAATFPKGGSK